MPYEFIESVGEAVKQFRAKHPEYLACSENQDIIYEAVEGIVGDSGWTVELLENVYQQLLQEGKLVTRKGNRKVVYSLIQGDER